MAEIENGIYKWLWKFGDGEESTEQNPTHQYTIPGKYTVSLKVTDSYGLTDTEVKSDHVNVYDQSIITGDYNLARANKCWRYGFNKEQGFGWSEVTGSAWPMPTLRGCVFKMRDANNEERVLVLDMKDGYFYDITTRDGPTHNSETTVYKDKVLTDGTGGTDPAPEVEFKEDIAESESNFIEHAESHFPVRPTKPANRGASGFDSNGFPSGLEADVYFYTDGEVTTAKAISQNLSMPKSEVTTDKQVRGNRILTKLVFNMSNFRLQGREQLYKKIAMADGPDNLLMSEDTYQTNLAEPTLWIACRTSNPLFDRVAGVALSGSATTTTGPDSDTESACTLSEAVALGNSATSGTIFLWRKSGYTISGISLTDISTVGTWILSYYSGTVPANITLPAGDIFDVRIYSSTIDTTTLQYLFDNIDNDDGNTMLPQWMNV